MSERRLNPVEIGKDHALVHLFALLAAIEDTEVMSQLLASGITSFLPVDAVVVGLRRGGKTILQTWHRGASGLRTADHDSIELNVLRVVGEFQYPLQKSLPLVHLGENIGYLAVARMHPAQFMPEEEFLLTSLQTLTSLLVAKHGADEALLRSRERVRESEQRVRQKLDSILSPQGDVTSLELADVINAPALQALMDEFYGLTRMPIGIIGLKGEVLVRVGWQDICTQFHRVNPESCKHCIESDTELAAGVPQGEFKLYHCKNHMWDVATPIMVGGKHVGNLFTGQFFFEDEKLDYELFKKQARRFGFGQEEYLAALGRVGRFKRETITTGMAFLAQLAHTISKLSYSNVELARSLEQRKRAEEEVSRRNRTLDGINRIFREALQCDAEEELGAKCVTIAQEVTSSEFGYIGEIGSDGLLHDLAVSTGGKLGATNDNTGHGRPSEDVKLPGLYDRVLQDGRSLLTNSVPGHFDTIGTPAEHRQLTAFLGVPLIDGSRVVGVAAVANRTGGYGREELESLEALAPAMVEVLRRKRAERALIRSEKLVSVGRLAATIAHEVNNPLAGATNAVYLIAHDTSLSAEGRAWADIADRELRRAAQTARRILGFYREPNGHTAVDVTEVVRDLAALYEPRLKTIKLKLRCDNEGAVVSANAGELRQLFSNLVANSIDAIAGDGVVHVRVKSVSLNGTRSVRITVADNGSGIEPQNVRRLFEPFFTTKRDVGSGLGLWICDQIARRNGGTINVRSRLGLGTVFHVKLPAIAERSAALAAATGKS